MSISRSLVLNLERAEAVKTNHRPEFDLQKVCFERQYPLAASQRKHRTGNCSRRAGKTVGCAALLLSKALSRPGVACLYLTLTRINAKRIVWSTLCAMNREWKLGGEPKEAELCIVFPNGSTIYLAGASDRNEIEKYRGMPLAVVVIDEAQSFPVYIENLVDEVLAPALMDYDGEIVLIGTPAPVPAGYFYECIQSNGWEHFEWTVFDNPWIERKSGKTPQQHLEAELKRRGISADDPIIQREWFGKWVYDPNSLVFRYDADKNDYTELPKVNQWSYVISGDLGFDDADALGVLGWSDLHKDLFLVEESVLPKQTITQLGDQLKALESRYSPLAIVLDTGGLGKKIAEELTQRWGLKVEAAEKERKLEHIELLNDAMRTGRFKAKRSSRFAQDCMLVEWDKSKPEKPKISDRYHSDACDMVLYGYRKALHWLYSPPPVDEPKPGTAEWQRLQAEELRQAAEQQLQRKQTGSDDLHWGWNEPNDYWPEPS